MKSMDTKQKNLLGASVMINAWLFSALVVGAATHYWKHGSSNEDTNNTTQATQPRSTNTASADYSTEPTTDLDW